MLPGNRWLSLERWKTWKDLDFELQTANSRTSLDDHLGRRYDKLSAPQNRASAIEALNLSYSLRPAPGQVCNRDKNQYLSSPVGCMPTSMSHVLVCAEPSGRGICVWFVGEGECNPDQNASLNISSCPLMMFGHSPIIQSCFVFYQGLERVRINWKTSSQGWPQVSARRFQRYLSWKWCRGARHRGSGMRPFLQQNVVQSRCGTPCGPASNSCNTLVVCGVTE